MTKQINLNSVALPAQGELPPHPLSGNLRSLTTPPSSSVTFPTEERTWYGFVNRRGPSLRSSCKIHKQPGPHSLTDTWVQHPVRQQENLQGVKGRKREVKPINSYWDHWTSEIKTNQTGAPYFPWTPTGTPPQTGLSNSWDNEHQILWSSFWEFIKPARHSEDKKGYSNGKLYVPWWESATQAEMEETILCIRFSFQTHQQTANLRQGLNLNLVFLSFSWGEGRGQAFKTV